MRLSSYVSRCRKENILYWIKDFQDIAQLFTMSSLGAYI